MGQSHPNVQFLSRDVYLGSDKMAIQAGDEGQVVMTLSGAKRVRSGLAKYDHSRALIVDPLLVYSTYLGRPGYDFSQGVRVDDSGSAYITGFVRAPTRPGLDPFQQPAVLISCTGLGAVSSPPADGAAGSGQLSKTQASVTIRGVDAPGSFSGLAPGFVGLYQVNAEVPAGLASGNQAVIPSIGGAASNSALLPVQ